MAKKKVKVKKAKPAAKKAAAKKSAGVKAKAAVAKKKAAPKAKAKSAAKTKVVAKTKTVAKAKSAPKRRATVADAEIRGNQDVETVRMKPKSRVARAGAGTGDLQGISSVEDVDSESADELLEEGQSFEAGIISGVERAGNEESEVVTHEVLEDDVPREYDDEKP
jgi:hypothetical protein